MIDRDTALGHHLFKITQTERVGDVPSHAQQHHIDRIVEALQHPGDARSKRLSRCLRFLHRAAKAYLSASNSASAALARQNPAVPMIAPASSVPLGGQVLYQFKIRQIKYLNNVIEQDHR